MYYQPMLNDFGLSIFLAFSRKRGTRFLVFFKHIFFTSPLFSKGKESPTMSSSGPFLLRLPSFLMLHLSLPQAMGKICYLVSTRDITDTK